MHADGSTLTVTDLFRFQRLGIIMHHNPADPYEAHGVLNPASARDAVGTLHLFPRLVGDVNFSRIGEATVQFDAAGNPCGVIRGQVVLSPERWYERNPLFGGGVEDPRITYLEPFEQYVMTYTAFSKKGPRIALAVSQDLMHWQRLGLVRFKRESAQEAMDLNLYDNKDAVLFPAPICDPRGHAALAFLHRPTLTLPQAFARDTQLGPLSVPDARPGIWISYVPLAQLTKRHLSGLTKVEQHQRMMGPEQPWEAAKIGMGTPPILTPYGWLACYHGVEEVLIMEAGKPKLVSEYRAGLVIFDRNDPRQIVYRTPMPLLVPGPQDGEGDAISRVIFPTGIDPRENHRIDVYYGMADWHIGVGSLYLPSRLPTADGMLELPT